MPEQDCPACRVAVVGGGAAGLMAAVSAAIAWFEAARPAGPGADDASLNPVFLLEKQDRVGRKLLATGNGQCNLGNQDLSSSSFHGNAAQFAVAALRQMDTAATRDFFEKLGLPLRNEADGRVYPFSRQASAVLDFFRLTANRLGVMTETRFAVAGISRTSDGFILSAADGRRVRAKSIVMATGGLAAPALGADGGGYALLTRFGHRLTALYPALVPIRTETDFVRGLAGSKFEGKAAIEAGGDRRLTADGEILFAEYGLSGPPILQISREAGRLLMLMPDSRVDVVLDLLPELTEQAVYAFLAARQAIDPQLELADWLVGLVHKKIGQAIVKRSLHLPMNQNIGGLTRADLQKVVSELKGLRLRVTGTRDWQQAQVTAGGLATGDFNADTLESRFVPGLYAAGEMLDIDGDCGGFNLQWAWSSGHLAGRQAMLFATGAAR